jgi:hypothetical protein
VLLLLFPWVNRGHRVPGDSAAAPPARSTRHSRPARRSVLKGAGDRGACRRPRHGGDGHTMGRAAHPWRLCLQKHSGCARVQASPSARSVAVVISRRVPVTPPTPTLPRPRGTHRSDQHILAALRLQLHLLYYRVLYYRVLYYRVLHPQHRSPYPDSAQRRPFLTGNLTFDSQEPCQETALRPKQS